MLNYILKPIKHESFHKKYAGKRYYKVCGLSSAKRSFIDKISLVERVYARVGSRPVDGTNSSQPFEGAGQAKSGN